MHFINDFGLVLVGVMAGIFITAIMTAGKHADELWNAYKKGYEDGAKNGLYTGSSAANDRPAGTICKGTNAERGTQDN